jgi:murein L,D-transpeptidase YafK
MRTTTIPTNGTRAIRRAIAALSIACVLGNAHAAEHPRIDAVLVYKSERLLMLLRAGEVVQHYRISLGRNPVGAKVREGDQRTPEGRYVLDWRNPDSRFYRSIHISYPAPADLARARTEGVDPGGDVMIHGLPTDPVKAQLAWDDWTDGCIAVPNEVMDAIWDAVDDGTLIVIRP